MEVTTPKPFVFVLMPFSENFTDLYEVGIKAACKDAGAYCERVNEQLYDESILERVYNQIDKADLIVAVMTGHNPNVFYETGYAHALNKRVIFLINDASDIPFDLKNYHHIVYRGQITLLKSELEKKIRWAIDNPKKSLSMADLNLQFYVNGVEVVDSPEIIVPVHVYVDDASGYNVTIDLIVGIHNPTNKVLKPEAFHLALLLPEPLTTEVGIYEHNKFRSVTQLPDRRHIYNASPLSTLFPQGWDALSVNLSTKGKHLTISTAEITIRLFTEFGSKDYLCILKFGERKLYKY